MVANFLNWIASFFTNAFGAFANVLSTLFGGLFQGLINVLKFIFKPIFILISIIFYVIYKLGELIVTLVLVIVAIGKILFSFIIGLFNTISSLNWTNTNTSAHGSWSAPIRNVFDALSVLQLDKVAYVISFAIWILTAMAAIKILSGRGGADV